MEESDEKVESLIETGSEIAGSTTGAAVGFLLGGPLGSMAGAVTGPLLSKTFKSIGSEIKTRKLSEREEIRIGAAFTFALNRIEERLNDGDEIREDGFLEPTHNNRAKFEEILEGVLLASQDEYEEKKLPFLGNLLANFAFESHIDGNRANVLLRIANTLTYRQLCIIAVFNKKSDYELVKEVEPPEPKTNEEEGIFNLNFGTLEGNTFKPSYNSQAFETGFNSLTIPWQDFQYDLTQEFRELEQSGIIECDGTYGAKHGSFKHIQVSYMGSTLFTLMGLDKMDDKDIEDFVNFIRVTKDK